MCQFIVCAVRVRVLCVPIASSQPVSQSAMASACRLRVPIFNEFCLKFRTISNERQMFLAA